MVRWGDNFDFDVGERPIAANVPPAYTPLRNEKSSTPPLPSNIMNRPLSLALLVGGIILIIYGIAAADSISSSFSRAFTGNPTDKSIWLLVGGAAAAIVGATGLLRGSKSL